MRPPGGGGDGPARALGAATGLWTGLQDGQDEAPILKILKSCQTNPAETAPDRAFRAASTHDEAGRLGVPFKKASKTSDPAESAWMSRLLDRLLPRLKPWLFQAGRRKDIPD